MRRSMVLFVMAASVLVWSCGGNAGEKKSASKEETKTTEKKVEKVKKKATMTLKMDDKEIVFPDVLVRNNASNPGVKSDMWTIDGSSGDYSVNIEFKVTGPLKVDDLFCSINGTNPQEFSFALEKFETMERKNSVGISLGVGCKTIKATFSGKVKIGYPGKMVTFSGTVEK